MGIYRSADGDRAIRSWCRERLDAWSVPHETRTVSTSLGETHLLSVEGGPVVVYVPGTTFNAATSLAFVGQVAERRRVVVADVPGQPGLSSGDRPKAGDRMVRYGAWLDEVVGEIDADRVVLAGHSLGAAIVLVSTPGDRVAGLGLVAPAGFVKVKVSWPLLRVTVPWSVRPTPDRSSALLAFMSSPGATPDVDQAAWLALVARHTRTTGAPGPLDDVQLARWRDLAATVVVGESDAFFATDRLREPVREHLGVDLSIVEGAGHLVPDEAPDRVAALVCDTGA